eukprot:GHVS01000621.1.p1 GENE.GHVS01000621.1~~GHVS01000621.1.p1  ORF type:complete len:277 (+),score=29.50 GHVS01000621.1:29-832(+)
MAKLRTGTRNLLAATPTLLLLAVSSLCFIALSLVTATDTTFGDAAAALKQGEGVIDKLTDFSMLYWLLSEEPDRLDVQVSALEVLNQRLDRLQDDKKNTGSEVVRATDVEFEDDRDKVKVRLVYGQDSLSLTIGVKKMKDNEEQKMEELFPADVRRMGLCIKDNGKAWKSVLKFREVFGDKVEVPSCTNLDVEKTFANIFSVKYSASRNILIEPPVDGCPYTINRVITVVVNTVGSEEDLLQAKRVCWHKVTVVDAPDSDVQDAFWI